MLKKDPEGDHGRNKRQQEVLANLIDKFLIFNELTRFIDLTKMIKENVIYSFELNQMPILAKMYTEFKANQEIIKMNIIPSKENGIWYELLQEKNRISYL